MTSAAALRPVPPPPPAPGQAPVPEAYPLGGQYPQDSPYPGGGKSEPGGRHRMTGAFQQPEPQPWPEAPAGDTPVVGAPALTGLDQYSQGDADPYGSGQGQFPPGQSWPSAQYGPSGQGLLGRLPFNPSPVAVAVAVTMVVGIILVVVGASALS